MTVYLGTNPVGVTSVIYAQEAARYNVPYDIFLNRVDENGLYTRDFSSFGFVGTGIKDLGQSAFSGMFKAKAITSLSFPDLTTISNTSALYEVCQESTVTSAAFPSLTTISGERALWYGFYGCSGLSSIDFHSLQTITNRETFSSTFFNCTNLRSVSFDALETIGTSSSSNTNYYTFGNTFNGCTSLTSVSFPVLTSLLARDIFSGTFNGCTNLTSISFPSLTTLVNNFSFGSLGSSYITEIHFKASARTAIENQSQYSSKFGCSNATIYFDL